MIRPLLLLALVAGALCAAKIEATIEPEPVVAYTETRPILQSGCWRSLDGAVRCLDLLTPPAEMQSCVVDMIFIGDQSGSIGSANYQVLTDGGKAIVQSPLWTDLSNAGTHFGWVSFSSTASTKFTLDTYRDDVNDYVNAITTINGQYTGGFTNIAAGLDMARQQFANHNTHTAKVAVLITDGQSNQGTNPDAADIAAATLLKNNGDVYLIVIGIGGGVDQLHLQSFADIYYSPETFADFTQLIAGLRLELCTIIDVDPNLNE